MVSNHSVRLLIVYLCFSLVFLDSYQFELQNSHLSGFPILNMVRFFVLLGGLWFLSCELLSKLNYLAYIYFFTFFLYIFSAYVFTDEASLVSYYIYNFVFGFFIFIILSGYVYRYGISRFCFHLYCFFIVFFSVSVYLELWNVERFTYNTDSLWQCGNAWNRRLCGATNNPNVLGIISFCIVAFSLLLKENKERKKFVIMLLMGVTLSLMALSRTAILGIMIMLFLYTLLNTKKILHVSFYLFLVVFISLITFYTVFLGGAEINERFTYESLSRASGRFELFAVALDYVNESPILGNGFDLNRDYSTVSMIWNDVLDNAYFNILVSYGFLGLLIFVFLFYRILSFSYNHPKSIASISIILSLLLIFFFEDHTFKGNYIWVLLLFVLYPKRYLR